MTSDFWAMIDRQLAAATNAISATRVCEIMPTVPDLSAGGASGFFAGSGGDDRLDDALRAAGWSYRWAEASYHWCMEAPDGSTLTYVEGDLYIGDQAEADTDMSTGLHTTPDDSADPADFPTAPDTEVAAADFPSRPTAAPPTAPSEPAPESSVEPPTPERSPRHGAR